MKTIGFVGAGNMARALGGGLAKRAGEFRILALDPEPEARRRFAAETGGSVVEDLGELADAAEVLVLAVKPQVLPALLRGLAGHLRPEHLVLSIAAGIRLRALAEGLGGAVRVVRAMSNTPALVGAGVSVVVAGEHASAADVATAQAILEAAGSVVAVDDESLLDAVTAVSGSGPGFVFAFAEAWLAAAEAVGLDPEMARKLVRETLLGSAIIWDRSGEEPAALRAAVTSPGGTTQAGLEALAARGFAAAVRAAIEAATRRSRELSAG